MAAVLRLLDVNEDDGDNFNAIRGIPKAPDMPFEAAVTVLVDGVPELHDENLGGEAKLASRFAKNHPDALLSQDQVAAINFYTRETPFYEVLNNAMRARNREVLKPFFPFLKIFFSALYLLELPTTPQPVYRGIAKQVYATKKKGNDLLFWSFSSTTASLDVLSNPAFLGTTGKRTILNIESRCFVDIRKYSAYQIEDERLLLPGTLLVIKAILEPAVGLQIFQLRDDDESPSAMDYCHPQLKVVRWLTVLI